LGYRLKANTIDQMTGNDDYDMVDIRVSPYTFSEALDHQERVRARGGDVSWRYEGTNTPVVIGRAGG